MDTSITATVTMGEWAAVAVVLLLLCAAPAGWLCWRFVTMDDQAVAHAIEDVQRFVELTDRARQELAEAPRLPLLDPGSAAATTAAINRFTTRKELAREALSPRCASRGLRP